jgi:hypothetical protein
VSLLHQLGNHVGRQPARIKLDAILKAFDFRLLCFHQYYLVVPCGHILFWSAALPPPAGFPLL